MTFSNDCNVCKAEVSKGIQCSKCTDWYHFKCVSLPVSLPKSFSNPGIFFFCVTCREVIMKSHVQSKKGGVTIVEKKIAENIGKKVIDSAAVKPKTVVVSKDVGEKSKGNERSSVDTRIGISRPRSYSDVTGSVASNKNNNDDGWRTVVTKRAVGTQTKVEGNSVYKAEVFVAGDSIIRHQGLNLREKLGKTVKAACVPGGKIDQISNAIDQVDSKYTVISVGTNEIGSTGYVGIIQKYKVMFDKLKGKNSNVIVVGILPRLKERGVWSSKAIAINVWLKQQCDINNFAYIDLWECMYENRYYYSRDGIHLNFNGRAFFSEVICKKIRDVSKPFLGRLVM